MKRPWEYPLFLMMGIFAAFTARELFYRAQGGSESGFPAGLVGVFLGFAILLPIQLRGARRAQKLNQEVLEEPEREWEPTKRPRLAYLMLLPPLLFLLFLLFLAIVAPDPGFILLGVLPFLILFLVSAVFLLRRW